VLDDAQPDVFEEDLLIDASVAGVERHQFGDVFEAGAQAMKHSVDVTDDRSGLSLKVIGMQGFALVCLVHLSTDEHQVSHPNTVFERKVLIPVPVAVGPGVLPLLHLRESLLNGIKMF
jgi:hypothetical protein